MSCSTINRKETEKNKLIQEKCQSLLSQMLRDEDNKYCVDCDAKGPRWASWNLGVFLCIRCAGIHRNLGVHISRVKSVNLDSWTPEQVISLQQMGNSRARAVYEAQLPDGFRRPQTDTALESFIRAKYEHKKYLAREWVPPLPPKVDWAKEIDEELERQKRKKKATQANSTLGIGMLGCVISDDKKHTLNSKPVSIPAPLSKPKSVNSPKIQRTANSENPANATECNQSSDLLGLSSPTKPIQNCSTTADNFQGDAFNSFLSAAAAAAASVTNDTHCNVISNATNTNNSLAKEEKDFFNQGNLHGANEKDKSGKLTKDSILALYGQATPNSVNAMNFLPQQQVGAPSVLFAHSNHFTGLTPGSYVGAAGPATMQQQQQFMTPPNSTSMYNSPVMTAPAAFTAPGLGGIHMNGSNAAAAAAAFAGHYQMQVAYPPSQNLNGILNHMPSHTANLPITNPMVNNTFAFRGTVTNVQPLAAAAAAAAYNPNMIGAYPVNPLIPTGNGTTTNAANVQQQFGKLNISNAWQ